MLSVHDETFESTRGPGWFEPHRSDLIRSFSLAATLSPIPKISQYAAMPMALDGWLMARGVSIAANVGTYVHTYGVVLLKYYMIICRLAIVPMSS